MATFSPEELKRAQRLSQTFDPIGIATELDNLEKAHNALVDKMAQLKAEIEMSLGMLATTIDTVNNKKADVAEVNRALTTIVRQPGPRGLPGRDGKDGLPGLPGRDGLPGKNGSPDLPEEIVAKINTLPEEPEYQIDAMHIKNLPEPKIKQFGGGLSKMTADLLYAPIGGSYQTPTGTVDDDNTAFTFSQKPGEIIVNGVAYIENHGWSWSGSTATLDNPVGLNGYIYGRK